MEDTAAKRRMYLLLALTAVIWGIQPLCIKWLVAEWSPVTISAMRYIFISAALLVIAVRRGEALLPPRHTVPALMAMGMTGILMNGCMQFTGLQYSTVTNCTLIAAASPAITAFFAAVCLRERLNTIAWFGIAVSFLGALVVVSHGSWRVLVGFSFNYGDILFLLAQVAWTVYSILAVRVMRHISAALCTGWAGAFGALATILYGIFTDDFHPTVLPFPLLALLDSRRARRRTFRYLHFSKCHSGCRHDRRSTSLCRGNRYASDFWRCGHIRWGLSHHTRQF